MNNIIEVLWEMFVFFVGVCLGHWICAEANGLHKRKEITCNPDKNIHIFDDKREVCHCMGMMKDVTTFSIPIVAQKKSK
jgi:carbamoylphosphate synthase small subunit